MNKEKILEALKVIQDELDTEDIDVATAIYQVYCECNSFIAKEIKRIAYNEGSVTYYHPEIEPLYKMFKAILPTMKRYCNKIKEGETE